jgi:phage gpG-like protein
MKTLEDALKEFRTVREKMEKLNARTPTIIGNECLRVIDQNFINQSYDTGHGRTKWAKRADATNKGYDRRSGVKGSVFNSSNPILEQTGNLRDGIKKKVINRSVFIGVNLLKVPYAQIHNEGGTIVMRNVMHFGKNGRWVRKENSSYKRVRKVTIKMPQRQYMPTPMEGANPAMLKAAGKKLQYEQSKIMKPFKKR